MMNRVNSLEMVLERERQRREAELVRRAQEAPLLNVEERRAKGRSRLLAYIRALLVGPAKRLRGERHATGNRRDKLAPSTSGNESL